MSPPSVPVSVWIWAALDPVLIAVAIYLGWKADQLGKIFIAAIAALGIALLVDALLTRLGIPWFAPFSRERPLLVPVRYVSAFLYAGVAFGLRRRLGRGP
ncbi:MAG: hypothetical protein JO048_14800 [Methylobacteriaceae bacterium]|nr:hypothetical protein [Methylobacteriaceae bacterium]